MPFCPKCGVEIAEDAKFCNACGATVQPPVTENADPKDTTAQFDGADVEKNKVLCLFAYLGILFLIPLLACPDSKFARYHANQGIVLFLFDLIVSAVAVIPVLGWIAAAVGGVMSTVFTVIGIVNAVSGRAKELPLVGKYRVLK